MTLLVKTVGYRRFSERIDEMGSFDLLRGRIDKFCTAFDGVTFEKKIQNLIIFSNRDIIYLSFFVYYEFQRNTRECLRYELQEKFKYINAKSYIGVINILILNIDSVRWDTERTSTDTEKV